MKTVKLPALTLVATLFFSCVNGPAGLSEEERFAVTEAEDIVEAIGVPEEGRAAPGIYVHYMPWYQAPPVSSGYGWHWHMGYFEPYRSDERGFPEIASHYMPLTGPYDSSNPLILEYQSLLMIMSGIDGVIADWYGIRETLDYGEIHKASRKLFSAMGQAGLQFAVCYEDQTMIKMVENGSLPYRDTVPHGKEVMQWLDGHWFQSDTYLKLEGRPVVLDFGPQFFTLPGHWDSLFEGLSPLPLFITLDGHMESAADGLYPWPPMHQSSGGTLSLVSAVSYLSRFYRENRDKPEIIATAFPGFHDIYKEAGAGNSYGFLDSLDGETFRLTLRAAVLSGAPVIQIATWNDYGEGTVIEPTVETGYTYLEEVQNLKKRLDRAFPFGPGDLRIPLQVLRLRRDKSSGSEIQKTLDDLFRSVVSGDYKTYKSLAGELGLRFGLEVETAIVPSGNKTDSTLPQVPEGDNQALRAKTRENGHVYAFISENAVDGDVETYWEGAQDKYPNEITIDLGSTKDVKMIRIRLNPKRIWSARTMNFSLLGGDGEGNFSEILPASDYSFDPESNGNSIAVEISGEYRYLRLIGNSNSEAKAFQIAELEVY